MKKYLTITIILIIFLSSIACERQVNLPDGIFYIDEDELIYDDYSEYDFMTDTTFNDLIRDSDYIIKFEVKDKNFFSYEKDKRYSDGRQIAISYNVRVTKVIYGEDFTNNKNIVLYSYFWESRIYQRRYQTNLEEGKEYIAFINEADKFTPVGVKNYIDYYLPGNQESIIICESKNTYLVRPTIEDDIVINNDTTGYPGWVKIVSSEFEEFLFNSMSSD